MKKTKAKELSYGTIPKLDLKMRITFLLLIVAFFQLKASSGYSQKTIISLNLTEVPIKAAFAEIESLTEFRFFYKNIDLDLNRKVTLKFKRKPINAILEELFKDQKIDFEVFETQIVLKKAPDIDHTLEKSPLITTLPIQFKVNGTITDDSGAPLPGASIVEKGTLNGTQSDFDGNYSLEVVNDAILVVSYIGFDTKEVPVAGQQTINVTLSENTAALDEVVVVGYGSQRKKDIVSAVSVVDMKQVKDVPASDASRLLLGQAPGVVVSQTSGRPGQELDIVVRGLSSLGATSKPLYVIDGFPVGNSLGSSVDPADIESITVLKDAASTAIYGARGSNGVILINTKKAKAGRTSVTLDVVSGFQQIPDGRREKMLNAQEFGQFQKESWIDKFILNEGREPSENEIPERIRTPEQYTTSTDWFDEITDEAALFTKYNLNINSGGEKTRSAISLGYLNQDGTIIKTNFERYNIRANIETDVTDKLRFGANVTGSRSNERFVNDGSRNLVIGKAYWADPREPVYNEDGSFNDYLGGYNRDGDLIFGHSNPVQELHEVKNSRHINRLLTNAYVEFDFFKIFKFKSLANVSLIGLRTNNFRPSTLAGGGFNQPPPLDASLSETYQEEVNWSTDQLLSYSKVFNEDHDVDVLLGYSAQEATVREISGTGSKFPDDQIQFLQNSEIFSVNSSESSWSLLAYFARLNYAYKDKYLLSATYRQEGSSRFGSNNRWGSFPSVSVGWRVSDEAFLQDVYWLNDLKLRASYGITGNNNIGNYRSLSTLTNENYVFGNTFQPGKILSSLANTELGWEESNQINYGLDLTILDGLDFTAEYYKKETENMLLPVNIPVISGFTSTFTNIGKVQNTGFEFALGYRKQIIDDLSLRGNFNISFNRNKVLAINGDNDEIRNGGFYGTNNVSKVGRPIGMLHGFRNLGVFQNQAQIDASPTQDGAIPGSFIYFDNTGDGVVSYDTTDWVEIGNPHPEYVWAFTFGADYKAFDLNVVLTGAQNYDIYRNFESTSLNLDGVFNVDVRAKERFRSAENPGNGIVPTSNFWKWERESNSFYVHDASHMWIRNISLGYNLSLKSDALFSNARLYISGDNLHVFTTFPGGNPQVSTAGGINPGRDDSAYPVPRSITLGATLSF